MKRNWLSALALAVLPFAALAFAPSASRAVTDIAGSMHGFSGRFILTGYGIGGHSAQVPTNYYVSNSGSDSNNGLSPSTPWQTVGKVNSSAPSCATVNFNGGQTFTDTGIAPSVSGTASCALTFTSYGTGRATIAPTSASVVPFKLLNQDYVTLNNLNLTAGASAQSFWLSSTSGTHTNITMNNFTATGGNNGAVGGDAGSAGWNNVLIENFLILNSAGAGLGAYGNVAGTQTNSNIIVQNGTIHDNGLNGVFLGNVNGGLIQNVVAYNNGGTSTVGPVGIWTYESNAVTIQFNESYNNTSANGTDGDGFDIDGGTTNCLAQYNYSHGNLGTGYLLWNYAGVTWNNNTVRYNISENDGSQPGGFYGSITFGKGSGASAVTNAQVYNNTIYTNLGSGFSAIAVRDAGTTGHVANNILYTSSTADLILAVGNPSSLLFTGNDYYASGTFAISWNSTSYSTFSAWQTATSQEKISGTNVGLTSNPSLQSPGSGGTVGGYAPPAPTAYELLTGSPMIGAGLNLSTQFSINPGTQDYYGNAIPEGSGTGYPVGAYGGAGVAGSCTGGTRTASGGNTIITFTSSGTLNCPSGFTGNVLAVGGGGGGSSGGGGGGGYQANAAFAVSSGSTSVTVGAGGAAASPSASTNATNGSDSIFGSIDAAGGGGGGGVNVAAANNGGSGGGCGAQGGPGACTGGTASQGFAGGDAGVTTVPFQTSGGGGAGAVGAGVAPGGGSVPGAGGAGASNAITGSAVTYGGGGGGSCLGASACTAASGGAGGGGNGNDSGNGSAGTANTGGGGGSGTTGFTSGAGGSGIVIISCTTGQC